MTAELARRPEAKMYDIETLVAMAWNGEIRVPHFQRDFRWQRRDVIRLFDSILKGYPVGSLLLWRRPAPKRTLTLGALTVSAPQVDNALWVVDGQQRITSLANALHPDGMKDDRFQLAYDLEDDRFVPSPAAENPIVIPLPEIFDLEKVLAWFARYPEVSDYVRRANAVTRTLRQFTIPGYEVVQDDVEALKDIFDRMNNFGKRLRRSEIFSALFAGHEAGVDSRLDFDQIAEDLDSKQGFGTVDNDTILKAILARRGPNVLREIRNEFGDDTDNNRSPYAGREIIEFPDEDRDTAYRLGEEAMHRAVDFLQQVAGVPHVSMLPYRHLLVVLTRLFAHFPQPDIRSLQLLRRWFWRAAMVGPENFKGSTTGAVRTMSRAVKSNDLSGSIEDLLSLVHRNDPPLPDLTKFRSNEAGTKIVLCAWWSNGPRSLYDGEPVDQHSLSEYLRDRPTALDAVRDIVPRQAVPKDRRAWAANRLLLPDMKTDAIAVGDIVASRPLDLNDQTWTAILNSHALDDSLVETLGAGDFVAFLNIRHELLREQLTTFLASMCEWGSEDTPPLSDLAVEDLGSERA